MMTATAIQFFILLSTEAAFYFLSREMLNAAIEAHWFHKECLSGLFFLAFVISIVIMVYYPLQFFLGFNLELLLKGVLP